MRVWKQVGVSLAVVGAGLCLWGFYSPDARNVLASIGIGRCRRRLSKSLRLVRRRVRTPVAAAAMATLPLL